MNMIETRGEARKRKDREYQAARRTAQRAENRTKEERTRVSEMDDDFKRTVEDHAAGLNRLTRK